MIDRRGLMFVLSSPSGAGKTSIAKALLDQETNLEISISATTRPKRPGEVNHKDYHFIEEETFNEKVENEEFLEHAKVFGNMYGTPRAPVKAALRQGRDVLFDIDWQGARQLAHRMRGDLVSIFILPPSLEELNNRLRARNTDGEDVIKHRMDRAISEINHWIEYGYIVINRDLDETIDQVRSILHAERLRRRRQRGMDEFVAEMTGQSIGA